MSSPQPDGSNITPYGSSTFEYLVRHLGLSPSEYADSVALKNWVRRNKDEKYVPPQLLELWGFEVNAELDAVGKPPKRAA